MNGPFQGKRILLGVSGSIAAYKAVDLASKLTQANAIVSVLMSPSATRFVTPLTFRSITHQPVITDLFDVNSIQAIQHIAVAKEADVLLVAPATAHTIAKLALGLADDPISVIALATKAPMVVAPAMDANMWHHPAVRANADQLLDRGVIIVGPAPGHLASGLWGWGRLSETPDILGATAIAMSATGSLHGQIIVVTAGGTEEAIDPVRVITNRSSGKMGYAIAEAARDRGAKVILVTAPTTLQDPYGVITRHVQSAAEMHKATLDACDGADALIMAAAVSDYTPKRKATEKIKKRNSGGLTLDLEVTRDILLDTPPTLLRVGFAAESSNLLKNALTKLEAKKLDFIVANNITTPDSGFGSDNNEVTIIDSKGSVSLPRMTKYLVATHILDKVSASLKGDTT